MSAAATIRRPVLRYHGGKYRLAPWLLTLFPDHRIYTEAYGGAASVLMRKPRSYAEVYNDLDGEIVNVFRVMRDAVSAEALKHLLESTPFARAEFYAAYEPSTDPIEQARRTIIKSFAGFGSASIHDRRPHGMRTKCSTWKAPTGFRSNSNRSGTTPAHDWQHYPENISTFCARLQGVVIENRPALDIIRQHDREECLHYVDPPYPHATRHSKEYRHELTDEQHCELAAALQSCSGMVVISSYASDLYARLYRGWRKFERPALADGARRRTEVVWINPAAHKRLKEAA